MLTRDCEVLCVYYLLFNLRHATFSEYVIYRAEQFVFSEVICGKEGERSREFIPYPLLTRQVIIVWERETEFIFK